MRLGGLVACLALGACGGGSGGDTPSPRSSIATSMQQALRVDIQTLVQSARDMQLYSPPGAWDPQADAQLISLVKAAWIQARESYERIEGAVAMTYPGLDFDIDSRYEEYLARLGPAGDQDAFDDEGVVGLDAIERILWSDSTPQSVVDYEKTLAGYAPAAFPATDAQAAEFRDVLVGKLVGDASSLLAQWTAREADPGQAYAGLVALMTEQRDELAAAPANAEESRYSQRTMDDLRSNLEGTRAVYGLFRPAVQADPQGTSVDAAIEQGFERLDALYGAVPGDAVPAAPATWDARNPSATDLASDYGELYEGVAQTVDPKQSGTLVDEMNRAAALLGL